MPSDSLSITVRTTFPGRVQVSAAGTPRISESEFEALLVSEVLGERVEDVVSFRYAFDEVAQERIRWLIEDFPSYPHDPGPALAALSAATPEKVGDELFGLIFGSRAGARIWRRHEGNVEGTSISIRTADGHSSPVPWDLMRLPTSQLPLALAARSLSLSPVINGQQVQGGASSTFTRLKDRLMGRHHHVPRENAGGEAPTDHPIRVLLVISRPDGAQDVPFLSVSQEILDTAVSGHIPLVVTVLRPPTWEQLQEELRRSFNEGELYDIVHFDGHGAYFDPADPQGSRGHSFRGFLVFEAPNTRNNRRFVDGAAMARALCSAAVPVLVVNACRSGLEQPIPKPREVAPFEVQPVAKYGSFAREVVRGGTKAVVAMRYNVSVEAAATFISYFYGFLTSGVGIADATASARRALWDAEQRRRSHRSPVWLVPLVVDGGADTTRFRTRSTVSPLATWQPHRRERRYVIPHRSFCNLEREFSKSAGVLLHGPLGSGKTSLAREFADWYRHTGGVQNVVFIDLADTASSEALEMSLPPHHIRRAHRTLVVLDHLEVVSGFPTANEAAWNTQNRRRFLELLAHPGVDRCLWLLTSLREQDPLASDRFARVECQVLSSADVSALCQARTPHTDPNQMSQIVASSCGNPSAAIALVAGSAGASTDTSWLTECHRRLNTNMSPRAAAALRELATYCSHINGRDALSTFADFGHIVNIPAFHTCRVIRAEGLQRLEGLQAEELPDVETRALYEGSGSEVTFAVFAKCLDLGLVLDRVSLQSWSVHPHLTALSASYRDLEVDRHSSGAWDKRTLAFVQALAALCTSIEEAHEDRTALGAEEIYANVSNISAALDMALARGWHKSVFGLSHGLQFLYVHIGALDKLRRDYARVIPHYLGSDRWTSRVGTEALWTAVVPLQVFVYRDDQNWAAAEALQRHLVAALKQREPARDSAFRERVRKRELASAVFALGEILRAQKDANCVQVFREAYELFLEANSDARASTAVRLAGDAFRDLAPIRNYEYAERCYHRAAELIPDADGDRKGSIRVAQAAAAWARAREGGPIVWAGEKTGAEFIRIERLFKGSLALFPEGAVAHRAAAHNDLAMLYREAGRLTDALSHLSDALKGFLLVRDYRLSALVQENLAGLMERFGRLPEAREYANAAQRNYQRVGDVDAVRRLEEATASSGLDN
jgi:tetratricopeptide (TPR) repeat protein